MIGYPENRIDWRHAPPGLDFRPLAMHDASLLRVTHLREARRVELLFRDVNLERGGQVPPAVEYCIALADVRAARASVWEPPAAVPDLSRRLTEADVATYTRMHVEVSVGWDEALKWADRGSIRVFESLLVADRIESSLHLTVDLLHAEALLKRRARLVVAGGALEWTRSDGVSWSEAALDAAAVAYLHQVDRRSRGEGR